MYLVPLFLVLFIYEAHSVSLRVKDIIDKKVYYNLSEATELFDDYIEYFNKTYESKDEYEERLEIFTNRLALFNHHNTLSDGIFGLSIHTDLKVEELNMGGCILPNTENYAPANYSDEVFESMQLEPNFNWIERNAVTPVKNQGGCGSCWAFSAVGAIEGLCARKNKQLVALSEQEVLDCSGQGNCDGGDPIPAMNAIARIGMVSAADYPYTQVQSRCALNPSSPKFMFQGGTELNGQNDQLLQQYLMQYGPLSATLYTSNMWSSYRGNVVNGQALGCIPGATNNHGVLIVGWGTTNNGLKYWIIKNSHGVQWGAQGYLFLAMGENACGINNRIGAAI